jgi:hypothetical protein
VAPNHTLIGVTYEIDSQGVAGSFTVPEEVCRFLGVDKGSLVDVEVVSASGRHGPARKTLISDRQPSPVAEMSRWMRPHERIRVIVSKP